MMTLSFRDGDLASEGRWKSGLPFSVFLLTQPSQHFAQCVSSAHLVQPLP